MYLDDKKYTWGYIIVLAVIILLCLIGGLFGEANAAGHSFGYEKSGNPGIEVNCYNGMSSYCLYQYDSSYDDLGRHLIRKYVKCDHCNAKLILSTTVGTHVFSEWKTYGMGTECYDQARDCNCGYRETRHINHEESDWSAWKYICYEENSHQDYYERYITKDGFTATDYKYVEHKHVVTTETASRSYHWINFGDNCQYSVTRECERCGCNYEDIKDIKKHEYKLDRVEDGHDVLVCVSCGDVVNREHIHEMQCVDHADSTTTKHGFNKYCCANCNYYYRVELPLKKVEEKKMEEFWEKYYDEETNISYFESTTTSKYYYRSLNEAGDEYVYAASFEELFNANFAGFEEYDPLYFEEYFPYALTIETGVYAPPEV